MPEAPEVNQTLSGNRIIDWVFCVKPCVLSTCFAAEDIES